VTLHPPDLQSAGFHQRRSRPPGLADDPEKEPEGEDQGDQEGDPEAHEHIDVRRVEAEGSVPGGVQQHRLHERQSHAPVQDEPAGLASLVQEYLAGENGPGPVPYRVDERALREHRVEVQYAQWVMQDIGEGDGATLVEVVHEGAEAVARRLE